MAPQIQSAKITLTYPLYVSDWIDENRLVVGGGGGSGRNGVGNKIVSTGPNRRLFDHLNAIALCVRRAAGERMKHEGRVCSRLFFHGCFGGVWTRIGLSPFRLALSALSA